jgi:hypothetical protein
MERDDQVFHPNVCGSLDCGAAWDGQVVRSACLRLVPESTALGNALNPLRLINGTVCAGIKKTKTTIDWSVFAQWLQYRPISTTVGDNQSDFRAEDVEMAGRIIQLYCGGRGNGAHTSLILMLFSYDRTKRM